LLVLAFAGCGRGSKEEEILDTLLLVARNVLQFGRLAAVMRQCVLFAVSFAIYRLTFSITTVDPASLYFLDRNRLTYQLQGDLT
jgi:hypothetical protein